MEYSQQEFEKMFEEFLRDDRGVVLYGYGIDLVNGQKSIPKYAKWFASQVFACLNHSKGVQVEPTSPTWMTDEKKVQRAKEMGFLK